MSIAFSLIAAIVFVIIALVSYLGAKSAQEKPLPAARNANVVTYDKNGNVIARDQSITPVAVKGAKASNIRSRMEAVHNFYRKQSQVQADVVIDRDEEQQRIFENYFHVLNYRTTTCNPLLKAMADLFMVLFLGGLISGLVGFIFGLINEETFGIVLGVIFLIAAVVFIILKISFQKKFEQTIKSTIAPKDLISHEEYEELVAKKVASLNLPSLSLDKLGVDDSQVGEVRPIILRDKSHTDISMTVFNRDDHSIHSSTQHVTVIYFTNDQLFVYKIRFDMCCNVQTEWTSEFFYQDICDISTKTDTNVLVLEDIKVEYSTVSFDIIASNSSIGFEMVGSDENLASIRGMQQKIRDKKNA